jgi:hypothetical protein
MRRPALLMPLLALPLLLAGCSSSPAFTVPDDADPEATIRPAGNATAPAEPYVLRVEVRHESGLGDGIPGAAVVFFDASQPAEAEAARTGPDGAATARFFVGGTVSIAAGGLDRYTVEEARQVVLGDPGEQDTLTIVLYDRVRTVEVEGVFPTSPLGSPAMPAYADVDVRLSDDDQVDAGYLVRLWSAAATLRWDNSPTAYGDLYAGLRAADDSAERHGGDSRQAPGSSGNEEAVAVEGDDARSLGGAAAAGGGLQARAASRGPVAAPGGGLPFRFTVEAEFKGSDITIG